MPPLISEVLFKIVVDLCKTLVNRFTSNNVSRLFKTNLLPGRVEIL